MSPRLVAGLVPAILLAGCVQQRQSVTLLPGEPGHDVGAVAVLNADGSDKGVLAAANTRANLAARKFKGRAIAPDKVDKRYGQLMADLPPPPAHFTLHFDVGESDPGPEQEAILQAIFKAAAERPGAEVQVVGHTDTMGTMEVNDRVSHDRAEEVRNYLIKRGLPAAQVRATWRGERELAVPTGDQIPNAANRRVEVVVR